MAGGVKRLPYPDHCRILEGMFRGWTAEQLLEVADTPEGGATPQPKTAELVEALRQGLAGPEPQATWSVPPRTAAAGGIRMSTLPPRLSEAMHTVAGDVAHDLGRKLLALQKTHRLSDEETRLLANLSGHVLELSLAVAITIDAGGESVVTYRHELLNLIPTPLRRLQRELWFLHTSGGLAIWASPLDDHKVMIQRTYDAPESRGSPASSVPRSSRATRCTSSTAALAAASSMSSSGDKPSPVPPAISPSASAISRLRCCGAAPSRRCRTGRRWSQPTTSSGTTRGPTSP